MSAKINDGLTKEQRYVLRHKNTPEYKERNRANANRWARENPERHRANGRRAYANGKRRPQDAAKRRAKKKNQTPEMNAAEWAEINAMYLYNQIMPCKWHVDHIDPLDNGGLHHPSNLQILSEHDNCSKGARI